jgi:hypothetical protein
VTAPGAVSLVGLRGTLNERRNFIITTIPPHNEATALASSVMMFPHLVDSGGYTTQIVLLTGRGEDTSSGTLRFTTIGGQPLNLRLQSSN